jgi:hypothetical protein
MMYWNWNAEFIPPGANTLGASGTGRSCYAFHRFKADREIMQELADPNHFDMRQAALTERASRSIFFVNQAKSHFI